MKTLIVILYVAIALLVAVALSLSPAFAQAVCEPHDQVVTVLQDQYGEEQTVIALTQNGLVMELFTNPENDTWTALITHPDGNTCMVSAGTNFEFALTTVPGQDG